MSGMPNPIFTQQPAQLSESSALSNLDEAKQGLAWRLSLRADLTGFDRSTVFNLGSAILESDFNKLQAIVRSYRHYAEQFARMAYVLASELRCPEISILRVAVHQWKANGADSEHKICVFTLRLDNGRRLIDIATDPNYGVHVFGQSAGGISGQLAKLNEDPLTILKRIGTKAMRQPCTVAAAWWN